MKTYTVTLLIAPATTPTTTTLQAATCDQVANAYLFRDTNKTIIATYRMLDVVSITSA